MFPRSSFFTPQHHHCYFARNQLALQHVIDLCLCRLEPNYEKKVIRKNVALGNANSVIIIYMIILTKVS